MAPSVSEQRSAQPAARTAATPHRRELRLFALTLAFVVLLIFAGLMAVPLPPGWLG